MNAKQYSEYQSAVASFLTRNNCRPGLHGPAKQDQEPFFSWRACECCGSKLGGNLETYSFAVHTPQGKPDQFEADICTDCVYYLAYGQLDDMTMMDMETA